MIGPSTRLNQNSSGPAAAFPGVEDRPPGKSAASQPNYSDARSNGHRATGANGQDDAARNIKGAAVDGVASRREATPSGDVCQLLSLLADRTRLRILRILAGGERPVVSLTSELRLPQPTVSHHLAWLRMMDLVSPRRQGKHVFYALGPTASCDDDGVLTLTANDATVTITPIAGG